MRVSRPLLIGCSAIMVALLMAGCDRSANEGAQTSAPAPAGARDFMVVANRPNQLHLIDLAARNIVRSCDLPGQFGPGTVQMGPENRVAYVLSNRFENVYGVDMDTCDITFSAKQSYGNIRIKTIGAFAVSRDGDEVWIHQNPAQLNRDHYVAMDAQIAVYRTADGLNAKPVRTFESPRQITLMTAGPGQTAYLAGRDIYEMNTDTGDYSIKFASQSDTNPLYSQRDSLSVWPIGLQSGEMIRMYSAARFEDERQNMDTAEFVWGFERVDLNTGEAEMRDFGPLEVMLFSGMTRPGKRNEFYAALTQLKRYDVDAQTELASVDLDHSYYCVNFSTDGNEVYLGGTFNEIAIFDADTLTFKDKIVLPGGDQSLNTTQVFARL